MYMYFVCRVPTPARKGYWLLQNWSYRKLYNAISVLGMESRFSARTMRAL